MSNTFVYQSIQGPIRFSGQSGYSGFTGQLGATTMIRGGINYIAY